MLWVAMWAGVAKTAGVMMVALPSVAGELGVGFRPVRGSLPRLGGTWLGHWVGGDAVHYGGEHRGGDDLMSEVPGLGQDVWVKQVIW